MFLIHQIHCTFLFLCTFFPIGKPWTLQYLLQQLMSKSLIWPTMLNGCRCDRETLSLIEEAGFKMVQAEKIWVTCSPEMFTGGTFRSIWNSSVIMRVINSVLFGFAENGEYTTKTKEKKILWIWYEFKSWSAQRSFHCLYLFDILLDEGRISYSTRLWRVQGCCRIAKYSYKFSYYNR